MSHLQLGFLLGGELLYFFALVENFAKIKQKMSLLSELFIEIMKTIGIIRPQWELFLTKTKTKWCTCVRNMSRSTECTHPDIIWSTYVTQLSKTTAFQRYRAKSAQLQCEHGKLLCANRCAICQYGCHKFWQILCRCKCSTLKSNPRDLKLLSMELSQKQHQMALQLPHTFRPHKVVDLCCQTQDLIIFRNLIIFPLQRSYKQKPPPGKTRDVGRETEHVLSKPGDFLFLDKFTSTGFINRIYNMEVLFWRQRCWTTQETSNTRKKMYEHLTRTLTHYIRIDHTYSFSPFHWEGAGRWHLGGYPPKVWNHLDAGVQNHLIRVSHLQCFTVS